MRFQNLLLPAILLVLVSPLALSQSTPSGRFGPTPAFEFGLHYVYLHANAPPAQCGCFSLNGGGGSMVFNLPHGFSLVADLSSAHAGHVDGTTQNITLFNALGGVRYTFRSPHRSTPYAQGLVGSSSEYSNYAFVQNVSALAAGGSFGLNAALTRHIGWNIFEAGYLYSRLPNADNKRQSDFRLSSGIIFRFGAR